MNEIRHRKAIRSAIMAARSLAGYLDKRTGQRHDMSHEDIAAFAAGVRTLCSTLERERPTTVRAAKDIAIAASPWHAGNALVTILNQHAQRQGIDPYGS